VACKIDDVLVAEVVASRWKLLGKPYLEAQRDTSVGIACFWKRGSFQIGQSEILLRPMLFWCWLGRMINCGCTQTTRHRPLHYRVVEGRISDGKSTNDGSAGDNTILQRAGIEIIVSVIITTCNYETNIYLAIFCRLLRPDIQIISYSTLE
jgi:hypothetical protein